MAAQLSRPAREALKQVARADYGKLLALLIHQFKDIELSEDVLQDAIVKALQYWSKHGLPQTPAAWLLQTARRKAIDRLRRVQNFELKSDLILRQIELDMKMEAAIEEDSSIPDERLRLIFTCCHPALDESVRVALTLKTLCGLSTRQVASAFVVSETSMAQRLLRARKKIKSAAIPYQVPGAELIEERLSAVLAVIYFIFNEGYFGSGKGRLIAPEFCNEAVRLAEVVLQLMPGEAEIQGLLALMLFHQSRFAARLGNRGELVDLESQNRQLWDKKLIATADKLLSAALISGNTGVYQLQAAISGVHAHALHFDETDWKQIVMLYHRLLALSANPVVEVNLAVALSYAESPQVALGYLDQIGDSETLTSYYPCYLARASMYHRLGQIAAAAELYQKALKLCENEVEKEYLQRRLNELLHQ